MVVVRIKEALGKRVVCWTEVVCWAKIECFRSKMVKEGNEMVKGGNEMVKGGNEMVKGGNEIVKEGNEMVPVFSVTPILPLTSLLLSVPWRPCGRACARYWRRTGRSAGRIQLFKVAAVLSTTGRMAGGSRGHYLLWAKKKKKKKRHMKFASL